MGRNFVPLPFPLLLHVIIRGYVVHAMNHAMTEMRKKLKDDKKRKRDKKLQMG